MTSIIELLNQYGIQPTPQRIAVAEFVLKTNSHPTADEVWATVREGCPTLSRATVYNTLNLFAEKGLLKLQPLKEGVAVFDPNVGRHHHLVDEETGKVYDIPWESLSVSGEDTLEGFVIRDYQVVLRGIRRG
jgi:Fe2+ or Zn2+ uptake regulation protein